MNKPKTIDAYIADVPKETRAVLETMRKTIREEIPDAEEVISYAIPAFRMNGRLLVYFAAWKKHVSMYPFTPDVEQAIPEASAYKTSGKGTIQFPLDKPLPVPLIRKIVKYMVKKRKTTIPG